MTNSALRTYTNMMKKISSKNIHKDDDQSYKTHTQNIFFLGFYTTALRLYKTFFSVSATHSGTPQETFKFKILYCLLQS